MKAGTKVEIPGTIWAKKHEWNSKITYDFVGGKLDMSCSGYMKICEHTICFEIPAEFNPVAAMVDSLEKQREQLKDAFHARVREINEEISKLQAICYDAKESA